ncbi:MAG: hypothetical protein ACRDQ0_08250 [Pseudonocardia sp.]
MQLDMVSVTSATDRREHLVTEAVFATTTSGRWIARCGALVLSADLGSSPGTPCELCAAHPERRRTAWSPRSARRAAR